MKRRKSVVVVFLLAAAMMLSVGYAALTDTLTISGDLQTDTTVAMGEFDDDVYFSGTSIVHDDTGNKAVSQILDGRDDAKIQALHFTVAGQVVKAMFTITNKSENEFAASIVGSAITVTNGDAGHEPIFSADWSWAENSPDQNIAVIQPGDSKDLWVTITLLETPQEIHTAEFSVSYTATAVDPAP